MNNQVNPCAYYKNIKNQIGHYQNMTNIFIKLEYDQKLNQLGEFLTNMFKDELEYTMGGRIKRAFKTPKKTSRYLNPKLNGNKLLYFQRQFKGHYQCTKQHKKSSKFGKKKQERKTYRKFIKE